MSAVWDSALAALRYDLVEAFHDQERGAISFNDYIDRLLQMVRPAPPQTIDRDKLVDIIGQAFFEDGVALTAAHLAADRIFALLRPVDGIVLTREEAQMAAAAVRHEAGFQRSLARPEERMGGEIVYYEAERRYLALANRLEQS